MWKRRYLPMLLGLATVLLLAWVRVADPYPVRALREIGFDVFQQLLPRPAAQVPIRIIDVDERALAEQGQWPWPRDLLARLTQRLTELGAASITYDMLFSEPDRLSPARRETALPGAPAPRDFDAEFAQALGQAPAILGFGVVPRETELPERGKAGIAVVGDSAISNLPPIRGMVRSLPQLNDAAVGLGSITLDPGSSVGTVRRLPLLWSAGGQIYPALALEALRVALGEQSIVVFGDQLGQGTVDAIRLGGIEVPTNADGSIWLYYEETSPELYVSAADILGDDYARLADAIAGHIVLIGTSATGLLDIRGTPLGRDMPGVEIHAQALQQILAQRFLSRADWVSGLEILAFTLIGAIIVVVILLSGPWVCLGMAGVLAALAGTTAWFGFVQAGFLADLTFPVLGWLIVYSAMIFFQFTIADSDKRMIRQAFGHYVAPALLTEIEKNRHSLKLGGETRDLTILFLDIRGFTTLSEGRTPENLVNILTKLFSRLGARITEQSGTIDKFIGDAIMAFWNAPVDVPRHPLRAARAALAMRTTLAELNAADTFGMKAEGGPMREIAIGIGLGTGPALVGNLGLETHFNYSCVGDTVNVASRIEGACKPIAYDIAVGGATRAGAAELAFLDAGYLELKGKSEREHIYALVGDEVLAQSPAFKTLEAAHTELVEALASGAPVDELVRRCMALCQDVEPGLARFFEALPGRAADFAPRQTVST